jgi:hypothetical protein
MEAIVLYLLLAAWARPRDGPAALLPLFGSLALLIALLVRELLTPSTVSETTRLVATTLAGLAWSLAAARASAPPVYWQSDDPRGLLILGAIFGLNPNAGPQPLAFWASLLLWLRGLMLPAWEPGLDDALGRLRLGCLVVGLAVGFASVADPSGLLLVQGEQLLGVALFLVVALLTTSLARRREMAGGPGSAAPRAQESTGRPASRLALAPLLVIGAALAALAFAAWGADTLSPEALAPAVAFGQAVLLAVGSAIGAAIIWLISLLSSLLPSLGQLPPPDLPAPPPAQLPEGLQGGPREAPGWLLALLLFGVLLVAGLVGTLLFILLRRALAASGRFEDREALLDEDERPTDIPPRGPAVILALLMRLLRAVWPRSRSAGAPRQSAATAQPDDPERGSIRAAYRAFLAWAALSGLPRDLHETPDELQARLQQSIPASAPEASIITRLYVDARYGHLPTSPADLDQAQRALTRLRATAAPASPPSNPTATDQDPDAASPRQVGTPTQPH